MLVSSIRTHHSLVPLLPFSGVSRTVGGAKSPAGRLAGRDITLGRESEWWNTGCWLLDLQRPLGCWTMRFKLKSQPGSFRNFFLQCCFFSKRQSKKLWKSPKKKHTSSFATKWLRKKGQKQTQFFVGSHDTRGEGISAKRTNVDPKKGTTCQ